MKENCAECRHHDVFWGGAGCNLLNNGERCKFEPLHQPAGGRRMNGNCGECERRYHCEIDPAECDNLSEPVLTNFEKIKEQIAAAGIEELIDMLMLGNNLFGCRICASYREYPICDMDCRNHCRKWLQQPAETEEKK